MQNMTQNAADNTSLGSETAPERDSYDIIVIGAGPAGLSAALTARNRGLSVCIVSTPSDESGLYRAERVDNYPGLPELSGRELHEQMYAHANAREVTIRNGRVISSAANERGCTIAVGSSVFSARALILATGVVQTSSFPGEREFLGRGVSYCATCDGMLFRRKTVAVIGFSSDAKEEAEFLRSIGCEVLFFESRSARYQILGGDRVETLTVNGEVHSVAAVFILRPGIAPESLLPGLELDSGHIKTKRDMSTNIAGVFAAGDATGKPYQIAKAVGEGNVAALSASEYLSNR